MYTQYPGNIGSQGIQSQYQARQGSMAQGGMGMAQGGMAQGGMGMAQGGMTQGTYGQGTFGPGTMASAYLSPEGAGAETFSAFPSPEAYHMPHYVGNMLGHDQSLRGDSYTPAQQQTGMGLPYGTQGGMGGAMGASGRSMMGGGMSTMGGTMGATGRSMMDGGMSSMGGMMGSGRSMMDGGMSSMGGTMGRSMMGDGMSTMGGMSGGMSTMGGMSGGMGASGTMGRSPSMDGTSGMATLRNTMDPINSYSNFRYGVRGNEQAFTPANDVTPQFGFNDPVGRVQYTNQTATPGAQAYLGQSAAQGTTSQAYQQRAMGGMMGGTMGQTTF